MQCTTAGQRFGVPIAILTLAMMSTGCLDSEPSASQPNAERSQAATLEPYTPCESDDQCGDLSCVALLGKSVCVRVGCADDESACTAAETCVVTALHESGVCAHSGSSNMCQTTCSDPLRCALDNECIRAGCCGEIAENGCPSVCANLGQIACQVDPRCGGECCATE